MRFYDGIGCIDIENDTGGYRHQCLYNDIAAAGMVLD